MKEIKELSEHIDEELEDADKYINSALLYKSMYNELAEMYYELSLDELNHVNRLHDRVVKIIKALQESGEIIPEDMKAIYNYLHNQHISKATRVKTMQMQYKELSQ